jgi:hypothetical protein
MLKKTVFAVPQMDCAAEERLIRLALFGKDDVRAIHADLAVGRLTVVHDGPPDDVDAALRSLNLGSRLVNTTDATAGDSAPGPSHEEETRTLKVVLAINASMFVGEAFGAVLADSSALVADSLDMFADAVVYGLALFGVHRARATQLKAARLSGVLQEVLAAGALAEVVRRLVFGSEPEAPLMVVVAAGALVANGTSMWLLARHRQGGAHMKAAESSLRTTSSPTWGVILAAGLVRLLGSNGGNRGHRAERSIRILRLKA